MKLTKYTKEENIILEINNYPFMILSERVKKLRDQSLNAVEKISAERAMLITQFYKSDEAREL